MLHPYQTSETPDASPTSESPTAVAADVAGAPVSTTPQTPALADAFLASESPATAITSAASAAPQPPRKAHTRAKRIALVTAIVIAVLGGAFAWYVNDYYHADNLALAAAADANGSADGVTVQTLKGGALAFVPENPRAGLIFYPGAKVQPEAYAPLLEECAKYDILCVLLKPRFNLALLDTNAASGIQEQFPQIETWFIAGHSMGGVAASTYLSRHQDSFDGIVFLASYPMADLSTYDGYVLSITGENDQVLNWANYENARSKLPESTTEMQIKDGNHGSFGNYGEQAGDGAAAISAESQQAQTANAIGQLLEQTQADSQQQTQLKAQSDSQAQ